MANFGAFVYMNARDIGLTIDTIPVISLGIGLGVDYGIYPVARIRDEVRRGAVVEDAVTTALKTTGAAVFSPFTVMVGGIVQLGTGAEATRVPWSLRGCASAQAGAACAAPSPRFGEYVRA